MEDSDPPRVCIAALADGSMAASVGLPALDEAGGVRDPLVLVELDNAVSPAVIARAAAHARGGGRLYVGLASAVPADKLSPLLTALDMTLLPAEGTVGRQCVAVADPAGGARAIAAVVARFPQAALVLGQVLRASEGLGVPEALDVESFAYSMLLGGAEFRRWLGERGDRPPPPLADQPVRSHRRERARLLITLNRPQRRNAYGRQLRDALADALRVAVLDPGVEAVVLDGAGPAFCSGGDLAEFGTTPDPVTAHFIRTQGGAGLLMHQLADRLEVRVHGSCVGAGVELPAFAGTVTAKPDATFTLPEVSMGLLPGAGGTVSIPRRIGRWRTLYLALTGRPVNASTARSWGLIDRIRDEAPRTGNRRLPR